MLVNTSKNCFKVSHQRIEEEETKETLWFFCVLVFSRNSGMSERAEGKSGHPVCAIGLTQLPDDVLKHIGCFCDERTLKALSCTCVKLKIMFSVVLATRAANRIEQSTATKAAHPVFVSFHPYHFQHTETLIIFFQSQRERDSTTAWVVGTEAGLEDALQEVFVPAQLFAIRIT